MCKKRGGDRHGVSLTRFSILVGVALLWGPTAAPAQIQSGLVGYWKLDNNFTDRSPGHRDLTANGGIAFGPGTTGSALLYPADITKFASRTEDDAAYNFGSGDFTISVWLYYNSTAGEQIVIEKFTGGSGPGWTFAKGASNDYFFFGPGMGTVTSQVVSISLNAWHHLVVVRSGGSVNMWFDNSGIVGASVSGSITPSTKPLLIGRRDGDQGLPLNGRIDEVAIWSRALSPSEINDLYTAHQMICGCTPKPPPPSCVTQPSGFASGNGLPGDPYQVCSPSQLDNVRNQLNAYFVQTADIDMCGASFSGPIGSSSTPFNGNYDGQHFRIANFSLSTSLSNNTGLFGEIGAGGGTVSNIHLQNCNVRGIDRVGCIAGKVKGLLQNSSAIGTVSGDDFIGVAIGEIIEGGIVASTQSGGSASGRARVGGIVGSIGDTGTTLHNSYSHANANASVGIVGGLTGHIRNGTINNCYSTGTPTGPSNHGGLLGFLGNENGTTTVVSNSYWDVESSGLSTSAAGTGKTTAEMQQQGTFVNWDFVNTWSIDEGNDYPRLRSLSAPAPSGETDCANGIDDDCDSFIDCDDTECTGNVACLAAGVPAVSSWGVTVMALLTATAASLILRRRAASA